MSNTEAAMTRIDLHHTILYMLSKPAYFEYSKYESEINEKIRNEEIEKRKAAEEGRKSKI